MLPSNPYRKLVVESYYYMASIQVAYMHVAMDICLLDELKILNGFMEGESFHSDVFDSIKDPAVQRINRFLKEIKLILEEFDDANHFLDEEIDEFEDPKRPVYEDEDHADKQLLLCLLILHSERLLPELTRVMDDLCELNSEPRITNFDNIDFWDDENVQLIVRFYQKVLEIMSEFREQVIRENEEKENRQG